MTKYREILRLKSLGFSERNIAQSCGVSRNTIAKVLKKAAEINLSWPLGFDMTDSALEELMFPKNKSATNKRMLLCQPCVLLQTGFHIPDIQFGKGFKAHIKVKRIL